MQGKNGTGIPILLLILKIYYIFYYINFWITDRSWKLFRAFWIYSLSYRS